jgi:hypothetical protein
MNKQRERCEVAASLVGKRLTPYGAGLLVERSSQISRYGLQVEISEQFVGYVFPAVMRNRRTKVVLKPGNVSCTKWNGHRCKDYHDFGVPCRHVLAVARATGVMDKPDDFIRDFFPKCVWASTYREAFSGDGIFPPPVDMIPIPIDDDDVHMLPPDYIAPAGRPRKKRIRNRGASALDGGTVDRRTKGYRAGKAQRDAFIDSILIEAPADQTLAQRRVPRQAATRRHRNDIFIDEHATATNNSDCEL